MVFIFVEIAALPLCNDCKSYHFHPSVGLMYVSVTNWMFHYLPVIWKDQSIQPSTYPHLLLLITIIVFLCSIYIHIELHIELHVELHIELHIYMVYQYIYNYIYCISVYIYGISERVKTGYHKNWYEKKSPELLFPISPVWGFGDLALANFGAILASRHRNLWDSCGRCGLLISSFYRPHVFWGT